MGFISEECYWAGWYSSIDVDLWKMLDQEGPISYGQGTIIKEELALLKKYHEISGGWWMTAPDDGQDTWAIFVPTHIWKSRHLLERILKER